MLNMRTEQLTNVKPRVFGSLRRASFFLSAAPTRVLLPQSPVPKKKLMHSDTNSCNGPKCQVCMMSKLKDSSPTPEIASKGQSCVRRASSEAVQKTASKGVGVVSKSPTSGRDRDGRSRACLGNPSSGIAAVSTAL